MLDSLYQSLDPIAISIGPVDIRWYALAYIVGFLLAGILIYRVARHWKLELTVDDVMGVMIGIMFGVILGGRLGYVLFYGDGQYLQNPLEILAFNKGGMSFHGGLIGAIIGGWGACRVLKLSFPTIADLAVIGAPLGLFFGRIANFVNGELWGKETDVAWGVVFGGSAGAVPRHPSQLYEAVLEGLVIFIVLYALSRKRPPHPQGTFIGVFLVLYGIFRFLVEFVRVPDAQLGYLFGPVTMGQLLSIPLILVGLVVIYKAGSRRSVQKTYISSTKE